MKKNFLKNSHKNNKFVFPKKADHLAYEADSCSKFEGGIP